MIRNRYTPFLLLLLCACEEPARTVMDAPEPGATVDSNVLVLPAATDAEPRIDNDTVILRTPPDSLLRATVVPPAAVPHKPLFEVLRPAQPDLQIFTLHGDEERLLTTKAGTLIGVRRESFVLPSGEIPAGPIRFTVQEFYGLGDALAADLTTRSDDRMLETGGMLYLEASSGAQRLLLRPGAAVELAFPAPNPLPGMQLFSGSRQQGAMDWALISEAPASARVPVYEPAAFPGGMDELKSYLSSKLTWPDELAMPGTTTQVDLRFVVDPSGKARPLSVLPAAATSFEEKMAATFARMPRWKPAQRLGIAVADTFTQSFRFGYRLGLSIGGNSADSGAEAERREVERIPPSAATVQYYVFRSTRLGYLNCDRFLPGDRSLTEYLVHTGPAADVQVRLVFHSLRSVIDGLQEGAVSRFPKVPPGEKVTIVVIRQQEGRYSIAVAEGNTGTPYSGDFSYEPATEAVIKEKMRRINRL